PDDLPRVEVEAIGHPAVHIGRLHETARVAAGKHPVPRPIVDSRGDEDAFLPDHRRGPAPTGKVSLPDHVFGRAPRIWKCGAFAQTIGVGTTELRPVPGFGGGDGSKNQAQQSGTGKLLHVRCPQALVMPGTMYPNPSTRQLKSTISTTPKLNLSFLVLYSLRE